MTTTAQSIITTAMTLLQDDGTRWPATELVRHLNDGQREIAMLAPDTFVTTIDLTLDAGPKQALPTDCAKLVEIARNTDGAAVTQVDRAMLDAVEPSWYTKTASATIRHTCYDLRDPEVFWVYPPALVTASLDVTYCIQPRDVPVPGGPLDSNVTGVISCKDAHKNALLHFVLFRAYLKDAEFGGNATLSASHYAQFKQGLQLDSATTEAVMPTPSN